MRPLVPIIVSDDVYSYLSIYIIYMLHTSFYQEVLELILTKIVKIKVTGDKGEIIVKPI